jgi:hypothetical protein
VSNRGWYQGGGGAGNPYPIDQAALRQYPTDKPPDNSGMQHNPGMTLPFPQPQNAPVGLWQQPRQSLSWANGTGNVVRTATWSSPLFDLRPDIRGAAGYPTTGMPIWRPMGAAGQLFVQIHGLNVSFGINGLRLFSQEFGHVIDPNAIVRITPPEEITAEISSASATVAPPSAILSFFAPGSGYPIKYWRLELTFDTYHLNPAEADLPISLYAAYY